MSYEEQLRWHLEELPPEPDQPACLDGSLRVREWAQHYPQVDVEPGFFRPLPPPPPPPSSSSSSPSASPAAEAAPPPSATSHQLVAAVLKEHAKSAAFREAKTAELAVRLDECDARMVCAVAAADGGGGGEAKGAKPPTLQSVLEDVEMINLELSLLEKFTATCRESYELFLRRVDPQALAPYMESVEQVAERIRPDKPRIAQLVGRLSRRYDELRSGRVAGGGDGKGPAGNNVSTFVRKSIKYWVHPDNLTEIKCHILRHLPIYVFPNADGTPHNPAVSSVYYDNDDLQLYTGRLLKQDEAIALRIRWYGAPDTPTVFVENKVHYEDWTGEPSTKSRFGLEESLANEFMAGTFTLDARIRELAAQGKLPQKEIEAMDRLAKDVQRVVREKQLRPMVRTFYHRTAFQIPGSAKVRLSIDEDLTFIREDANVVGRKGKDGAEPDANWRRRDVGIDWPFQHLPENEVHHFPYAIMEVKLEVETGKEPPLWIRELMQSQLVEEAPKFSKFCHGSVSLLEPLAPVYPYWLHQMGTNIRHRRTCTLLELTRTNVKVPWAPQASAGADVEGAAMRAASQSTMTVSESSLSIASRTALSRLSLVSASGASVKRNQEGAGEKGDGRQQQQQPCDAKATPAGPRLPYMPAKRRKLMVPTVVEPKVHFANERTFLGWTHYALFLLNGATAVVRFGAGSPAMQLLRLLGVGVSVCAIGFLFVGLYVRERRRIKISWNPRQERMDSVLPLFVILFTVSFAVAVNWYAVYAY